MSDGEYSNARFKDKMKCPMTIEDIIEKMKKNFPDLTEETNWGERGLFYNPKKLFPKGAYVLTFKERDGKNDSASKLNLGSRFRLNLKISKESFLKYFEEIPQRPEAGKTIAGDYDFSESNKIMPHPVYGWMTWIAVINPSPSTIVLMEETGFFREAYQAALTTFNKKRNALSPN